MTAPTPGQAARPRLAFAVREAIDDARKCRHTTSCQVCATNADEVMKLADVYAAAQPQPAPGKQTPGQAAREADPERDAAEFVAWCEAQGYGAADAEFGGAEMADVFIAGMQAQRDLAAREQPAPELDALRDMLDEATRTMLNLGTRPAEINLAHRLRKQAGLAP